MKIPPIVSDALHYIEQGNEKRTSLIQRRLLRISSLVFNMPDERFLELTPLNKNFVNELTLKW